MTSTSLVARLRAAGCVFAEDEAALLEAAADGDDLERLVVGRVAGEPLEHLLGRVRFGGLELVVGPGVFVPRQRTVHLAELAAGLAARRERPLVVDLCCGCGAIGAVVAHAVPTATVVAADVDPVAVALARTNLRTGLAAYGGQAHVGDLLDALPRDLRGRVDVLAANVPYVPTAEIASMPPEARDHEPVVALDGGPDGLDVARRVAAGAAEWLAPGGTLLIEVGTDQVAAARRVMSEAGLEPAVHVDDDRGATVVTGTRRPTAVLPIGRD